MPVARLAALAAAVTLGLLAATPAQAATRPPTEVTGGLAVPWGVGFLPDGSALVTERDTARILTIRGGKATEVQKIADAQPTGGHGGLLGLAISPHYQRDRTVFVYYSTKTDNRIAKLRLGQPPAPLVTGIPLGVKRNGGRLAFGPDGHLYATTGDTARPELAQDPKSLAGKVLRLTTTGKPVLGNPFGTLVYSYGHRDPQGLTWDRDGRLFLAEAGDTQWDELNRVLPGRNYGWPLCEGKCGDPRFIDPLVVWRTEEATPSDLAYYKGSLYVAGLVGQRLWQVPLRDGRTGTPKALYHKEFGRLRTVEPAPDGSLWITTSNAPAPDRILRSEG
ncbi:MULTISPECIES: sorbosone dehydrogenase family protein [unclassified Crossiella]|uniref:PQQ-dependent sugar dehydrogenase n=1 Tax=unclassified Crossiella TaxID=2620835 RepID=UPI001FFF2C56|nr:MULTISPECIES: PQQ-dependent sugar dehydrogenase [unclassified Crossiella]MCK2237076.1 PQQ-dependent sugar dehydrogenase [Crossiella sp. S99.2]MCK2250744.1 PQQ-dependent sugar dehydrogenase [Crossiella sp. S99.1]